ncbi:MAG: ParB/RepB/Spo0J family partition protein [Zavarzinella sp.]
MHTEQMIRLRVDQIDANPHNPRLISDSDLLHEFADNIRNQGVIQPILVQESSTPGRYFVVDGHRRLAACKLVGHVEIQCILQNNSSKPHEVIAQMLSIDQHREDFSDFERGRQFSILKHDGGMNLRQIATRLGISESKVSKCIKVFHRLSPLCRQWHAEGKLNDSTLYYLSQLKDHEDQDSLATLAIEQKFSVQQIANEVAIFRAHKRKEPKKVRFKLTDQIVLECPADMVCRDVIRQIRIGIEKLRPGGEYMIDQLNGIQEQAKSNEHENN